MFIKGEILRVNGYDESFRLCGDWARWLKLAFEGGVFQYIPIIICTYNMDGMSSKNDGIGVKSNILNSPTKRIGEIIRVSRDRQRGY